MISQRNEIHPRTGAPAHTLSVCVRRDSRLLSRHTVVYSAAQSAPPGSAALHQQAREVSIASWGLVKEEGVGAVCGPSAQPVSATSNKVGAPACKALAGHARLKA